MAFYPEILTSEGAHVDDAEHVSLPRLDRSGKVLGIVEQGGFGDRLGSIGIDYADKSLQYVCKLRVIPIRDCEYNLLLVLSLVRGVWVGDDERPTEAVGVLSRLVRMVPVCAGLVDLRDC